MLEPASSGSFDFVPHDETVLHFAQDDRFEGGSGCRKIREAEDNFDGLRVAWIVTLCYTETVAVVEA